MPPNRRQVLIIQGQFDRISTAATGDPGCREVILEMAQRMLSLRMHHAERELVNLSASADGPVAVA